MRYLNDPRPWTATLRGRELSLADLIELGTLSREAAATVGWTLRRGASLFVAAGPPGAGKSTLANALLELLPETATAYVMCGAWDRADVVKSDPATYLLINELSWHMPVYVSGPAAQRAFQLLSGGVRIFGTLHARSTAEAVRVMCEEAEVCPTDLVGGFVVLVLFAGWRGQRIERRVVEVGFVSPGGSVLMLHTGAEPGLRPDGARALSAWSGLEPAGVAVQIAALASKSG